MLTRAKPAAAERPKRFYKTAEPGPVDGGFGVLLDGRAVRAPSGARLALPTAALAALAAGEWAAQGEHIVLPDMPVTRLAFTAVDRTPHARDAIAIEIAGRAGADALCYFADGPESLVELETARWGPLLDWAAEALGLELVRVSGLMHRPQPEASLQRVEALALALPDFALTGLVNAAGLYGSAVLAFALERGRLGGEEALELSRLDEAFQEARWGVDAEAAARTAHMRRDAAVLEQWFAALRSN
jgi:chaperone required for assembly of F1-ATPase